ncbi:MAG TPA: hypothetical protein VJB59_04305 [Bdellovibrionota bacterium]|nr:hypothetical protein [Bdellovibrionota bacterium]
MKTLHCPAGFLIGLLISTPAFASGYSPASDLNAAFGGGCSTTGAFSSTLDANAAALKGMLDSMKSDDACKGLSPLFDSVSSDIVNSLESRNTSKYLEENLTAYINDLNAAIASEEEKGGSADADYLSALKAELNTKKIALLQTKSNQDYSAKTGSHEKIKHLYTATSALMDGLLNNAACAGKYPNVLAQIGAQILKISSDYSTGLTGSLLMAAGTVVDKLVTFIRGLKLAKPMNDLEQEHLGMALGCAFESLSRTYCQARDVQFVAQKHSRIQSSPNCGWEGVDLVGRDMPAFLDWVSRTYAGSEPSSSSQATEKQSAITIRYQLDVLDTSLKGIFADAQKLLNQTADPDKKNQILIGLLSSRLVPLIQSYSYKTTYDSTGSQNVAVGPIGDAFSEDPNCGPLTYFYSSGAAKKCLPNSAAGETCINCVQRVYGDQAPDLGKISATWNTLRALSALNVSNREALVMEQSPALVLTLADTLGANQRRPRFFLDNAKVYLQNLLDSNDPISQGSAKKTVSLALSRVKCALEYLDEYSTGVKQLAANEPSSCSPDPGAPAQKDAQYYVSRLSQLLAPSGDTNSLSKEINVIVKKDIDRKIADGQIDEALAAIMKLSTTDSLSEFLKDYDQNLDMLDSHVTNVKSASKRQMKAVWDVFEDEIIGRLKGLSADKDPIAQKSLNLECARMLVVPFGATFRGKIFKLPDDVAKYCKGRKFESMYHKSKLVIDFNSMIHKSPEDRVCVVYDFFRKSKLYSQKHSRDKAK